MFYIEKACPDCYSEYDSQKKEAFFMKGIADFTRGPVTKQLICFALPLFASQLLQILYNMADMVIVGQVMGKVGLSAVAIGGDITNCLTFVAMGFSNAGQVLLALYIGAGKRQELTAFVNTLFLLLCGIAVVTTGLGLYWRHEILGLMQAPPESFDQALAYASLTIGGLFFIYGYNAISAILRGMGDAKHPFYFISIAAVTNIVLDIVLVIFCRWGAAGAAMATVLSQALSFALGFHFLWRHRKCYDLWQDTPRFAFDSHAAVALMKLGIPMAIKNASVQFSKLFVSSWINSYGIAVSAFAGIANKLTSTANLISNAINTAGSTMVGQNIGARQYSRVRQIIVTIFEIVTTLALAASFILCLWPVSVYHLFTTDEAVIAVGLEYLPIGVLCFFGCAGRSGMNALINGSGNTKVNFATAIFDGLVLHLGLSVLFGLYLNWAYLGFWLGDALANFTPLWVGAAFYASGKWKERRL